MTYDTETDLRLHNLEQRIVILEARARQIEERLFVLAGMDRAITAYDLLEALR